MPTDPYADFELIPWNEWQHHYWIATFSQFEPVLFVKACKHSHEGHEHLHIQPQGKEDVLTRFIEGADGNTYMQIRRANGMIELAPVYTLKQAV